MQRQVVLEDRAPPRRAEVLHLLAQLAQRDASVGPAEPVRALGRPVAVVAGMGDARQPWPARGRPRAAPGRTPGPSRASRSAACRPRARLAQQALVRERDEAVHRVDVGQPLGVSSATTRLDGLDVGTREAGHDGEEPLLGRRQELVAPVDRGAQRLLSLRQVARAAAQGAQAAAETLAKDLEREDAQTGRGQLDGQRQALEPATDVGHERGVVIGDAEVRPHGPGALDEEQHGLELLELLRRSVRATSAGGTPSGGTTKTCSPRTCSGSRLVTSSVRSGQPCSSCSSVGAADVTCSTLSRMRSSCRGARRADELAELRLLAGVLEAQLTGDRGQHGAGLPGLGEVDEGRAGAERGSTRRGQPRRASLVLPMPPGPVSVSRRMRVVLQLARRPGSGRPLGPRTETARPAASRSGRRAVESGRKASGIEG